MEEIKQPKHLERKNICDLAEYGQPTLSDIIKYFTETGANFDHVVLEQDYDDVAFHHYDGLKPLDHQEAFRQGVIDHFTPLFERYDDLTILPFVVWRDLDYEWSFDGFANIFLENVRLSHEIEERNLLKRIDEETKGEFEYSVSIKYLIDAFGQGHLFGPDNARCLALCRSGNNEETNYFYIIKSICKS